MNIYFKSAYLVCKHLSGQLFEKNVLSRKSYFSATKYMFMSVLKIYNNYMVKNIC